MSLSPARHESNEVISAILNWICPDCGGRMGGVGNEFKCQGECQKAGAAFGNALLPKPSTVSELLSARAGSKFVNASIE